MCGEQVSLLGAGSVGSGSSPRVRGTVDPLQTAVIGCRFIPACAGNRRRRGSSARPTSVHPRVCGEQPFRTRSSASMYGSSPRVRGTVLPSPGFGARDRFIPACAGNSGRPLHETGPHPVHPRVCGEQGSGALRGMFKDGSSPRVRGTGDTRRCPPMSDRFIPACAGNSRRTAPSARGDPVHPRVCGEQVIVHRCSVMTFGSSPRVRGTG